MLRTPAGPFLEPATRDVRFHRSITSSAVEPSIHHTQQRSPSRCGNGHTRRARPGPGRGAVLPTSGEIAALSSVISAWMRIGIFEAMDRRRATNSSGSSSTSSTHWRIDG